MPEPNDLDRPTADPAALPTREELLAADKDELVRRVESLARELRRRLEIEEEILQLKFQEGTASLQAQVDNALERFRAAEEELEAFRAAVFGGRGDVRPAARPFLFEDLSGAKGKGTDPASLRTLLSLFRKLRSERDRAQQEAGRCRQELERLRAARP